MSLDPNVPAIAPDSAKRPRGRPRVFDEMRRHELCAMISLGLSRKAACRIVGVAPSSVVHAARTDPFFAAQLQQALIDRDNRPPELADIGSRSWRAIARRLEARSPHFRLPAARRQYYAQRRLKRMIRRIVLQVLKDPRVIRRVIAASSSHRTRKAQAPDSSEQAFLQRPIIVSKPP
jgi:hypothetical protein